MSDLVPSQMMAARLLAGFVAGGVKKIFLAPGSRSQSLAIAAKQLADAELVDLHVRIDERSLGFTALGSALASQSPVILITTSGTAVANLHPAVLEANHSGVPLILLTADRPHELRGVGANQTTTQNNIFGTAVRASFDVVAPELETYHDSQVDELVKSSLEAATGSLSTQPGPVHVNLAFREPLSASTPNAARIEVEIDLDHRTATPEFAILDASVPTVVIAGADATPDATELAESFGWPLLAEPSSGARFGTNCILAYRQILETVPALSSRIGRVIVFGKPTLSRAVNRLFFDPAIEVIVIRSRTMGHFDVSRRAAAFVDEITVNQEVDFDWLRDWQLADNQIRLSATVDGRLTRREIVEAVWEAADYDEALVLGASRMIREADSWAPAKPIDVFSNRGLAGIDGTVATATGIALTGKKQTRAIMGDLTLLHDAGSLAVASETENLNLQIIVVNDHGGTIFDGLEMAKTLDRSSFEKLFRTAQNVNIAALAAAYGWLHIPIHNEDELRKALTQSGRVIIEVVIEN